MANVTLGQMKFSTSAELNRDHDVVCDLASIHRGVVGQADCGQEDQVLRPPAPVGPAAFIHSDPLLTLTPDKSATVNKKYVLLHSMSGTPPLHQKTGTFSFDRNVLEPKLNRPSQKPKPYMLANVRPDPSLTVTPDKTTLLVSKFKSNLRKDSSPSFGFEKLKHKVRFDVGGQCDSICPDRSCENLLPNEKVSKCVVELVDKHEENLLFGNVCPGAKQTAVRMSEHPVQGIDRKTERYMSDKHDKGTEVVASNSNHFAESQKFVVTREMQEQPMLTEYKYPFEVSSSVNNTEHVFSRPEFHNSLKMYSELKAVEDKVMDVPTALHRHLSHSLNIRQDISEKAALRVNQKYCSSVFNGLVGLEPPIDDLCQQAEKQISLRIKKNQQPQKVSDRQGPDLMEFYESDVEQESADLQHTLVSMSPEELSTAPLGLAFSLYRHNRVWDTHYFL